MRKIIYHVATSVDHFIADEKGNADAFLAEGDHVQDYLESLKEYDTVIMGRKTYEYGYDFGLEKGEPAYPHMQHYIFSRSLVFDKQNDQVDIINKDEFEFIKDLKNTNGTDIYLCGGGEFAGWALDKELIDVLKIKLNPVILGKGIPIFGQSGKPVELIFKNSRIYESGVVLLSYGIVY